ncbi:MAG: class I SAM-dependent methyltransferase [Acidobacteriota bacterium]
MQPEEQATGELFGQLFPSYDKEAYLHSMDLLGRRFAENQFPMEWFAGKRCLDVGCGGGRNTMALRRFGAKHATGIDISEASIRDARSRATDLGFEDVDFRVASAADIPFEEASFDGVLLNGVLQHVAAPITVLNELARVVRPGGMVYFLVYATEGLRWPLIQMLRPIAQTIGFEAMDAAVAAASLAVNKRRTYLDDLFVPYIDFYSWACLENLLHDKGFGRVERWQRGRLDHEESLEDYARDLSGLANLFAAAAETLRATQGEHHALVAEGSRLCQGVEAHLSALRAMVDDGQLSEVQAMTVAIGQGHHRVVAWRD